MRFEADAPADLEVLECTCSMCTRTGFLHLIVPAERFRLLEGQHVLTSYRFNTGVANHLFCSVCGVESFYVPRSHPDGYSVNLRCLDPATIRTQRIGSFDGANWEANISKLSAGPENA